MFFVWGTLLYYNTIKKRSNLFLCFRCPFSHAVSTLASRHSSSDNGSLFTMHATFIFHRTAVSHRTSLPILFRNVSFFRNDPSQNPTSLSHLHTIFPFDHSYFATLFSECYLAYILHFNAVFHSLRFHSQLAVALFQHAWSLGPFFVAAICIRSYLRGPVVLCCECGDALLSFEGTHGVPVGFPCELWQPIAFFRYNDMLLRLQLELRLLSAKLSLLKFPLETPSSHRSQCFCASVALLIFLPESSIDTVIVFAIE